MFGLVPMALLVGGWPCLLLAWGWLSGQSLPLLARTSLVAGVNVVGAIKLLRKQEGEAARRQNAGKHKA